MAPSCPTGCPERGSATACCQQTYEALIYAACWACQENLHSTSAPKGGICTAGVVHPSPQSHPGHSCSGISQTYMQDRKGPVSCMQAHNGCLQVISHWHVWTAHQHPPSSLVPQRLMWQRSSSYLLSPEAFPADGPHPQSFQSPPHASTAPHSMCCCKDSTCGLNLWKSSMTSWLTPTGPRWWPPTLPLTRTMQCNVFSHGWMKCRCSLMAPGWMGTSGQQQW